MADDIASVRRFGRRMLAAMRHEEGVSNMPRTTSVFGSDQEALDFAGFEVWRRLPDEDIDRFDCWLQAGAPE